MGIEVRIERDGKYLIWKREAEGEWYFHLGDHWEKITDPAHINSLEVGFKYSREFLRWQIHQLDSS
ncbi:hypothetical protein ES703_118631 [subsurface metagenome]